MKQSIRSAAVAFVLLFAATLALCQPAFAGHQWVAGIGGMIPYPASGNFTSYAGCTLDTSTYTPLASYACTANVTASSDQGVLIESQWFDASATAGNGKVTLHLPSQAADGKTSLWKVKLACDNGAQSVANPTFGTESATFTCTNDGTTAGREITCQSAAVTPNSTSNLGGANLAYTCLWAVRRFDGGTMTNSTASNIIGYELDIQ